ncbi:MAG TPA: acetamidase/formamidase family protein [Candidatus Polarisedimenticolaceae bacterium]|nr:acetamidase/formamidase family protein [Candidatus Polarisedimenticolaceae bacterium]
MRRAVCSASLVLAATAVTAAERPVLRYVPKHEELKYTFGGLPPTHHIAPGTRIVSWTEDCYDGALTRPDQKPSAVLVPGHDNPQTGPFYIEGSEPGDTLAIHIEKLEPARDYAISVAFPGFGALKGTDRTALLGPELPETVWFYRIDRTAGVARTRSQDGKQTWAVPLAPFLGCLGVSPAYGEARSTIVPGNFGGNMDCPEVRPGNTVYLAVRVPGAMLSFGDGHYAMGDGEIMGTAIEGAMNVELSVDLIKHRDTPWPRIENEEWMMTLGASRPLEDAARIAFKEMVRWVQGQSGLAEMDAYEFVSQNAQAPIVEIVDPEYTVLVKIRKDRLPVPVR